MSLKFTAEIICDSCGVSIEATINRSTYQEAAYWKAKETAEKDGWVTMLRGGLSRHCCAKCAEKIPARKLTAFTDAELAQRRETRARRTHQKDCWKQHGCWTEELFQQEKWKYGL